jgi:PAS domain-containing protein
MAGDFLGYIGICLDMTDSRSTTEALLNSEVRYRQIVETAQEGIWTVDSEMKTTFVNSKMAGMLEQISPDRLRLCRGAFAITRATRLWQASLKLL